MVRVTRKIAFITQILTQKLLSTHNFDHTKILVDSSSPTRTSILLHVPYKTELNILCVVKKCACILTRVACCLLIESFVSIKLRIYSKIKLKTVALWYECRLFQCFDTVLLPQFRMSSLQFTCNFIAKKCDQP